MELALRAGYLFESDRLPGQFVGSPIDDAHTASAQMFLEYIASADGWFSEQGCSHTCTMSVTSQFERDIHPAIKNQMTKLIQDLFTCKALSGQEVGMDRLLVNCYLSAPYQVSR